MFHRLLREFIEVLVSREPRSDLGKDPKRQWEANGTTTLDRLSADGQANAGYRMVRKAGLLQKAQDWTLIMLLDAVCS